MAIHLGCGSWADQEYVGLLYPKNLPAKQRLSGYAKWFDCVEVNSTFYATPRIEIVKGWVAQTPPHFTFDVKLHRAFSQNPRQAVEGGERLERMLSALAPLFDAKRFGTFLLVLPPTFGPAHHRLEELDALVENIRPHRLAVELRDAGWVSAAQRTATLDYFRRRELVWVDVDLPRIQEARMMPPVDEITHPKLAYLRLHGRNSGWGAAKSAEERHRYQYSSTELEELVTRIKTLGERAHDVHVYANNHAEDFAAKTALALKHRLGQTVGPT